MKVTVQFGAALLEEKKAKGVLINQCESFRTIVLEVNDMAHLTMTATHGSFTCTSAKEIPEKSSADYKDVFTFHNSGTSGTIEVAKGYIIGYPIPLKTSK